MHLLATTSGVVDGAAEPVDLRQTPADIVILTAADSEISLLARAHDRLDHGPDKLRLANFLHLQHPFAVDLYVEKTLSKSKLVILRLLGGQSYWAYGLERITAAAKDHGFQLIVLPGDSHADPELTAQSTLPAATCERLRQYFIAGGENNAASLLRFACALLGEGYEPAPAQPLPSAGLYRHSDGQGHIGIIFYRAALEGGQTAPIDALAENIAARGIGVSAHYVASLKDAESNSVLRRHYVEHPPQVIINLTSFAASAGGKDDPLAAYDCPVLQAIMASSSEAVWQSSAQGLAPRDLAMGVVLPELDGRIHSRVISFKSDSYWHEATQSRIITQAPVADRIAHVADLAVNWLTLCKTPASKCKIGIVLANYPIRDGRIANGVGYDAPASTIAILKALQSEGYDVHDLPEKGNALIEALTRARASEGVRFSLVDYVSFYNALPQAVRNQVEARWGKADTDPSVHGGNFILPVVELGSVIVGIQPSRGYNIDPKSSYHDPALVPPHAYFAFYLWLRKVFGAHAIIHNGKHGNLEWLPGKANGLSAACFPDALLGPLPHIYPFIVNDPGEGTQAKRRASAVIIDHLTPPLTRAESYGPLKDLEALIDEYYLASGLDRRRAASLHKDILVLTKSSRLDVDAGFTGDDDADLTKLDAYICDLKEAQIRDGLHILGQSPTGDQERDLLVALTRTPRNLGEGADASLIRALAADFGLDDFDPLSCEMAAPWAGPRPAALAETSTDAWRSNGDTVERLELFARSLEPAGARSAAVLGEIASSIRPRLRSCGSHEVSALLAGLAGKRVAPGPSGAPTRGRLDVLPTGRNFYSLDNRTVPTPTAWTLGQRSAEALLIRHLQDFGSYPTSLGLTAWGTSNMRTGGDDIAQALALIGAKPVWDSASWRVTGYEIIPLASLGRPRVDVTLRISGFFRDAFPAQIELFDKAIRACGALEEDAGDNPIAARMQAERDQLLSSGIPQAEAQDMAGYRIFGSKPGAYGAGLQALIDERIWADRRDLAAAYITWGSYAYGAKARGVASEKTFKQRLKNIEAVVHNQDNREHDLLDSDDYYQFEGGMSAAVEATSGTKPRVYHNDHSRPERPVIRTLEDEVGRVMRSRVVNPKWINGVKRHGYKGAFEIAATVDYMFAFAATTGAVQTHHFDLAFDAYLMDETTREFIRSNNPAALKEIAERFSEAATRGLWSPRLNSAYHLLEELQS